MTSRRSQSVLAVAALVVATMFGALISPANSPSSPIPASPASVATVATTAAMPDPELGDLYNAVLPEYRREIVTATASTLPRYTIEASLSPPSDGTLPSISGTVELRYVNTTDQRVDELPFRLNPNLRQYETGRMTIHDVTVNGAEVTPISPMLYVSPNATPVATPAVADADLILVRVPLPQSLVPGGAATVSMAFTTSVPIDPPDDTGIFRYHPDRGSWTLSSWYPMLAGFDHSTGWNIDPPAAWSDVTFGASALYDVTINAPVDLMLVTPGVETSVSDGSGERRFVSGPAREFAIVADPTLTSLSADAASTNVTVFASPEGAGGAEQVLSWATQALGIYSELFGPYPYASLDIVAVPDVIGAEFSEVIWLGDASIADPGGSASRPGAVEFLVAHEVAHQWWYGLVGSDPQRNAFLDEGLAEYSAVLYYEHVHGLDAAQMQAGQALTLPYATMLVTSGDQVIDQPSPAFPDAPTYYATTYRKSALGFEAIRNAIGNEAFLSTLREYAATHRFDVATPDDLLDIFEQSSDVEIEPLWHLWFETASGRVQIVMEPERGSPKAIPDD